MPKPTRTELEFVIEPEVRQFCGPLFFTQSRQTAFRSVTDNGSFGLVDTGQKKLLVTCLHVWEAYQQKRLQNPDLKLCLCLDKGNPVLFAPDKPIGENQKLDIATFDMEPLLAACGGRKFYSLKQNPAPKVEKGDLLFLI